MLEEINADFLRRIEMGHLNLRQALKGVRNIKKGFTLVELLVVLTITLVLASLGMYLYQKSLVYAKETVCQTNLRALGEAIEFYASENDALPASLGQLKIEHLEKAYAKAMEDGGWVIKACTFLIKLDASDHAYAQFLTYENLKEYGVTEEIFHCPADHNAGASYGINGNLEGENWFDISEDELIVADCDNYVFYRADDLAKRHEHKAFGVKKRAEVVGLDDDHDDHDDHNDHDDDDDDHDDDDRRRSRWWWWWWRWS